MLIKLDAHETIDSLTKFVQVLFNESPITAKFVTIVIVATPLYLIHTWGSVRRHEKSNDLRLKNSVDNARARSSNKKTKKGGKKKL